MGKKLKACFSRERLPGLLGKTLVRLFCGLLAILLWDRFVNTRSFWSAWRQLSPFLAVLFLAWAWFVFLRLDGIGIPRRTKKRGRATVPLDTDPDTEEGLSDEERDALSLAASLLSAAVFGLLSLF